MVFEFRVVLVFGVRGWGTWGLFVVCRRVEVLNFIFKYVGSRGYFLFMLSFI